MEEKEKKDKPEVTLMKEDKEKIEFFERIRMEYHEKMRWEERNKDISEKLFKEAKWFKLKANLSLVALFIFLCIGLYVFLQAEKFVKNAETVNKIQNAELSACDTLSHTSVNSKLDTLRNIERKLLPLINKIDTTKNH